MQEMDGPISGRLRGQLPGGDAAWWPERPDAAQAYDDEPAARVEPVPADVEGHRLGGRHQSSERRYRLGPWLVAVLTILAMGCGVVVAVWIATRAAADAGTVVRMTPSPIPYPCPTGGAPPCR